MQKINFLIDDFMFYSESKNLSQKTLMSYEQTIKLFTKYLEEEKNIVNIEQVTEKTIREYINYIKNRGKYTISYSDNTFNKPTRRKDYNKKISITTINNYIRNIRVFFNFCKSQNYIKKDIFKNIKLLKNERKPKEYISDSQFSELLRHIDTTKFHEYRDYIAIRLLLDSGMRVGECLNIKVKNLDLKGRAIFLPSTDTKSRRSRYIYFSKIMQKDLKRWLNYKDRYTDSEYLFCTKKGKSILIRTFEEKVRKYGQRIGIKVYPHQLRNNFAKRFLMSGGNIYTLSKILGHSSVTVTEQAYLDLTESDIRKNYQNFSPLANMK